MALVMAIGAGLALESGAVLGLRPASFIAACEDMRTVSDELANLTPRYPSVAIPDSHFKN